MSEAVTYDAFISYRHCEMDKFVAETLHERLESYRLPKKIEEKIEKSASGGRTRITRVFRDKDELPLTSNLEEPIIRALLNSEFLIVICSPRLRESMWCRKEIETFISMHGRSKVLAVLIEGEPRDSFPEELLYVEEPVTCPDGIVRYMKKPVEPLAADFRGRTKKEIKKAMNEEILRLLAPMFDVNYDDLKQRHRERRMRRIIGASAAVTSLGLVFGGYCAATALKIKSQNVKIVKQSEKILEQTDELEDQNNILKKQEAVNLAENASELLQNDDRYGAVSIAYQALTEKDGMELPYTANAQCALTSALGIYDASYTMGAVSQIETSGLIKDVKLSPNGKYILTFDSLNNIELWSTQDRKMLSAIEGGQSVSGAFDGITSHYGFVGDKAFFYISTEGVLAKFDTDTGEQTFFNMSDKLFSNIMSAIGSPDGSRIYMRTMSTIYSIDTEDMKELRHAKSSVKVGDEDLYVSGENDEVYYIENADDEKAIALCGVDMTNGRKLFACDKIKGDVVKCISSGNVLYVAGYSFTDNINGRSFIAAIDKTNGSVRWYKEDVGHSVDNMYNSVSAGKNTLLCTFGNLIWLLDADSGKLILNMTLSGAALYCTTSSDGNYLVYNANGNCSMISADSDKLMFEFPVIECTELSTLALGDGEFWGTPKEANRVVLYSYIKNDSAKPYDGDVAEPVQADSQSDEERAAWANENNIPKAAYISSYLEPEDTGITVVLYKDQTMGVYRSDSIHGNIEDKTEPEEYYAAEGYQLSYMGQINDYYIISDGISGYILNKDGELCARVPQFRGLTSDKTSLVVVGRGDDLKQGYFSLPVLSLDDIKKDAVRYLADK